MFDPDQEKYLEMLKLPRTATLADLKKRYAQLNKKFEKQIRSGDKETLLKGRNNSRRLKKAFTALSGVLTSSQPDSGHPEDTETTTSPQALTIELFSTRVGFQVLEGGMFDLETKRVDVNLFGLRASQSNASLKASWPAGKLTIYNDHIHVSCLLGSESISVNQVKQIEKKWYLPGSIIIRRKPPLEDTRVVITGWGLARKIKEVVRQNQLKIRIFY